MQKNSLSKIRTVLASLDLGLADDELDFLGNILFEDSPDFIDSGDDLFSTLLIFRTQEDAKVDDQICLPLQNQEFEFDDPLRPVIPDDTHPNCRCYWENADTGSNLGQDGAFATASITNVTTQFADEVDGKEGSWKTVNGTPVFFPDGGDPKDAIDKAFKDKPKSTKSETKKKDTTVAPTAKNKIPDRLQAQMDDTKRDIDIAERHNQETLGKIRKQTDGIEERFGKDSARAHEARTVEMKAVIKVEGATQSHNRTMKNLNWRENEASMEVLKDGTPLFYDDKKEQQFMIRHVKDDLLTNTNPTASKGLMAVDLHQAQGDRMVHKYFVGDELMVSTGVAGGTYVSKNNSIQLYKVDDSIESNLSSLSNYSHEKGHLIHDTSLEWDKQNLTTSDLNSEKFWRKNAISTFDERITDVSRIDNGLRYEISPYHESFRKRDKSLFQTEGYAEISRLRQTDVPAYEALKEANPTVVEMHRQIADNDFAKWFVSKGEIHVDKESVLT